VTTNSNLPPIKPGLAGDVLRGVSDNPEDLKWTLQGYLPRGALCVLSARHKVGKSSLVYGLTRAVLAGEPFLGQPTSRSGVLVLQLEEAPQLVAINRLRYGLVPLAEHHHLYVGPVYDRPGVVAQIRQYIEARKIEDRKIGLLIIDTISRAWTVEDENSVGDVLRAMIPWATLAHDMDITVLALHHWGHSARRARGASSFGDVADMILNLERPGNAEGDPRRILTCEGRYTDFVGTPRRLVITRAGTPEQPQWQVSGAAPEDDQTENEAEAPAACESKSLSPTARRILAHLAERPTPVPATAMLTDLVSVTKASLYRNLPDLEAAGYIAGNHDGWAITDAGLGALIPASGS
jgi:archaellum biogenesis ATPase FlaH